MTDCEEGCDIGRYRNESSRPNDARVPPNPDKKYDVDSPALAKGIDSKEKQQQGGGGISRALLTPRRRRPNLNLRLLNPNHVDAVFVEGRGAIKSLRDIQVIFYLVLLLSGSSSPERRVNTSEL